MEHREVFEHCGVVEDRKVITGNEPPTIPRVEKLRSELQALTRELEAEERRIAGQTNWLGCVMRVAKEQGSTLVAVKSDSVLEKFDPDFGRHLLKPSYLAWTSKSVLFIDWGNMVKVPRDPGNGSIKIVGP